MTLQIIEFIVQLISSWGYAGIFVTMTLESTLIPIPSEVVIPFAGFLAHTGEMNSWLIVAVSTFANLVGSLIAYAIGKYLGRGFIKRYGRYVLLNMKHLEQVEKWFAKYGSLTVLFSRMLPVIRTYNALPAGMGKMNIPKFCLYTFLGSIPWNLALVFVGYVLRENWNTVERYTLYIDILAVFIAAAVIYFLARRIRVAAKSE
jgi:membrane protein DedA with SNARE-associated domain